MKLLCDSIAVMSVALCATAALAAGEKGNKNSGGGGANNVSSQGDQSQSSATQNLSGNKNKNQNGNQNKNQNGNSNSNSISSPNSNSNKKDTDSRNSSGSNKNKLGDSNFDKNGIGRLDEKKFSGEKGIKWRYRQLGNEWWYWTPSGNWSYWRGGQWCNYDQNTYAEIGGAQGPYYEDKNGFFQLAGGRKVYDPQIHRDAAAAESCRLGHQRERQPTRRRPVPRRHLRLARQRNRGRPALQAELRPTCRQVRRSHHLANAVESGALSCGADSRSTSSSACMVGEIQRIDRILGEVAVATRGLFLRPHRKFIR